MPLDLSTPYTFYGDAVCEQGGQFYAARLEPSVDVGWAMYVSLGPFATIEEARTNVPNLPPSSGSSFTPLAIPPEAPQ